MNDTPTDRPRSLRAILRCDAASRLLSESRDRPLALRERLALRLHELICSACRTHRSGSERLFVAVRREAGSDAPDEVPEGVRRRVEERVMRELDGR